MNYLSQWFFTLYNKENIIIDWTQVIIESNLAQGNKKKKKKEELMQKKFKALRKGFWIFNVSLHILEMASRCILKEKKLL